MASYKAWIVKIWKDPVGSAVIAGVLLIVLSQVAVAFWHLVTGVSYQELVNRIWTFIVTPLAVPAVVFHVLVAFAITRAFMHFSKFYRSQSEKRSGAIMRKAQEPPIFHWGKDYHFFHSRLSNAFPGWSNEIKWYLGKEAVDRLSILLSEPLEFTGVRLNEDGKEHKYREIPLWWFRDTSSMHILNFRRIGSSKVLMNDHDELHVDKIAVYKTSARWFDFVYVETLPEKPSGAYEHDPELIKDCVATTGYYWEQYAMIGNRPITREEYDDGAAEIDGKVVPLPDDIKSRTRYLTKYNFIMTVNSSPYNSTKFEMQSLNYFNGMLCGSLKHEDFFNWLISFDRWEGRRQ